jgi:CheY-like chemotaxis protein
MANTKLLGYNVFRKRNVYKTYINQWNREEPMDRPLNILLVDNEAEFLETISYWLETKEHRVQSCYSGEEAIERVQKNNFDIIFLDIHMPEGIDGMETLRRIRSFNASIPVIMVTGFPQEEKMEEAIKLEVSGFFPKTGSFEDLGRILKAALRTHKDLR